MTSVELEAAIRELIPRTDLQPRAEVWIEIAARRTAGERPELPDDRSLGNRLQWRTLAAAAVLLILTLTPSVRQRPSDGPHPQPAAAGPATSSFSMEDLVAQGTPRPAFQTVAGRLGLRVQGGSWFYQVVGKNGELMGGRIYQSISTVLEGQPAWLLISPLTDSLWVTRDSLRPIMRVHPVSAGRMQEFYHGDEILSGLTMNGFTSWTSELADSTQSLEWAMVRQGDLVAILQAIPLHRDWKGSIPLTSSPFGRTWYNLEVEGEEEVQVPVGRFACWRLKLVLQPTRTFGTYYENHPVPRITLWVSKDPQWLVKRKVVFSENEATIVLAQFDRLEAGADGPAAPR